MSLARTRLSYTKNTDAVDSRHRLLITASFCANRIWYERFVTTSAIASWQPRPIAFSTIREETSSMESPQVHVPEADRRPAETRIERLSRVGFAAEARLEVEVLPDRVDRGPEGGRRELDDRVPDRVLDLPVLDEIRLPARVLRVVALVVDVPFHEALHVDAELHVLEELVHGVVFRLDERVGHPHDRLDVVVHRPCGAVAAGVHRRGCLAVLEELRDAAFFVQVPAPSLDALIVRTIVGDRVLDQRIVDDVHHFGADPHADPVRRDERLAGLAHFPSEDAVRLGRVAARFVRGDASHLRSGDEIHLSLRGLLTFHQGSLHRARFIDDALPEIPRRDSFPSPGPAVVPVRLFDLAVLGDGEEVEHPETRTVRPDAGAFRVREKFHDAVVAELEVPRGDFESEGHQVAVHRLDLRDLFLHGDVGELPLLRNGPVHLDRVFVRERDFRLAPRRLGDLDCIIHDRSHIGLRPHVRGREPEGAVHEDPYTDPPVLADVERVENSVLQDEVLLLLMLVSGFGVRHALLHRIVERKIREIRFVFHGAPPRKWPHESGIGNEDIERVAWPPKSL